MPALSATEWQQTDALSRWLIMVRGAVLAMTVSAAVIAILLSLSMGPVDALRVLLLVAGLTLAHATNNLINDWVDWRQGIDTENYFRARYGTHALRESLIKESSFLATMAATGVLAVTCGVALTIMVGIEVLYLTLMGGFFVLFYTWPMKHFGLGEVAVLLVWGPLMIGGSFYVLTETITPEVIAISLVYGIAPTLVIFGKHIDKSEQDHRLGIRTLPVLLGEARSRALSLLLLGALAGGITALAITMEGGYWLALVLLSATSGWRLAETLLRTRPQERPGGYPEAAWPLWFAAHGFVFARNFGGALILALMLRLVTL